MKRSFVFIAFFVLIIANSSFAQNEPVAEISFFSGKVEVKKGEAWVDAKINMELSQKDSIRTKKDSRVEIKFVNQGIIRLDENSILGISELIKTDESLKAKTKLMIGSIWIHLKDLLSEKDEFETTSPTAVAAVRGTIYRMDVTKDTSTDIYVYRGKVEVKPWRMPTPQKKSENDKQGGFQWGELKEIEGPKEITMEEWTVLVKQMQHVSVRPDSASPQVNDFTAASDSTNEWVQWNKERDKSEFGE